MSKEADKVLKELRRAQAEVAKLFVEYRKVCPCNDGETPRPANPTNTLSTKSYSSIGRNTCEFHSYKVMHSA
ncbi:hypothetical protein UFOVP965_63 [uncultured Caudovirales phage]|uniref:Uncharacterized protein n=1 Tax=uncultured Caudovirales phage TaxID=2100421 RepID=A0A6J5R6L2_9CAUD|nr:hypothetical protein UFOVP965_63 [uncultured Caudovirales phage]CAB4179806.1 hypothetical protein UFOVP1035_59 [uncultured Caudovirales phage]CAB4188405.1 hypothetical protein UFOVP1181_18 [uncultured Caudovirales phage]